MKQNSVLVLWYLHERHHLVRKNKDFLQLLVFTDCLCFFELNNADICYIYMHMFDSALNWWRTMKMTLRNGIMDHKTSLSLSIFVVTGFSTTQIQV